MLTRRNFLRTILATGLAPPFVRASAALSAGGEVGAFGSSTHSDELVDFISVQAQMNRGHPVWSRQGWRPLLGELGIRHVRSNLASKRARDHLSILHAEYGIRACGMVTSIEDDGSFDFGKTKEIIAFMRDEIGPEKIRAIEGPNEYTRRYKSPGWPNRLRDYQEFIFGTIKSDPMLKTLPVLAPTIWRRVVEDYRAVSVLGSFCDYGNLHLYSGGRRPSRFERYGKDEAVDLAISDAQIATPGKRICITETGFRITDESPTASNLPPAIAAKYTLRNVAELFIRRENVAWMSLYTLMDYSGDSDYGIVSKDLRPRHPYVALRNFISIVADPGPARSGQDEIAYQLHASSPDIRWARFHKRDGRQLLILWRDVDSYDRATRRVVEHRPQPAFLDFGDRKIDFLRVHAPTLSDTPVEEHKAITSIELQVPDDVLIVEMAA